MYYIYKVGRGGVPYVSMCFYLLQPVLHHALLSGAIAAMGSSTWRYVFVKARGALLPSLGLIDLGTQKSHGSMVIHGD